MDVGNTDRTQCFIGHEGEIEGGIQKKAEILAQITGCNKAMD